MEAAALALRLLRLCIDSGAYHVQLEGLNTIRTFVNETSDTPLGNEIAAYLQSIDLSGNLALSTLHVEILHAYGLIDFHYDGDLKTEIEEILRGPVDEDSIARARSIVSNQFEEVIGEPYFTAVESLDPTDKVRLYRDCRARAANAWAHQRLDSPGACRVRGPCRAAGPSALGNSPGTVDHPGNLGGSDSWEDAGPWRHRGSIQMSSASAR